jgi:hypothetical protein
MFRKLTIFDFDGTIFRSPTDSLENRAKFEKHTKIPWLVNKKMSRELSDKLGKHVGMRSGWWGRAETLEPPLVPSPAPAEWFVPEVRKALEESKADVASLSLIMTGRHGGLRNHVSRILHEGKLVKFEIKEKDGRPRYDWKDDQIVGYFLGDDGPSHKENKPSETLPWKLWIIQQFIELHASIETIEIWEDRLEHVEKFNELSSKLPQEIIVHHVI